MNRLPPYSSAQCSFISLPFLRTTHSSCLAPEGSPILSPLSRTEIVPHQSDTQPPLPTTWKFQNCSAKTAIKFFRSNRVYPLIPQGLGEFSTTRKLQPSCGNEQNERKARLPLLWEHFCRTAADRKKMRLILASVEMFALLEQRFVLWPFLNKEATSPSEDQYFTFCSSFKHNYFLLAHERDFSLSVKGHAALENQTHKHRSRLSACLFFSLGFHQ